MYIVTSNVTFTDDRFSDSHAQLGGAILAIDNSVVKMYTVTIGNNRADYGGGMAAVDSQLELLENTFFVNNWASYGGGLYVHNTEFNGNAIFTENSVTEGGGAIYASKSTFFSQIIQRQLQTTQLCTVVDCCFQVILKSSFSQEWQYTSSATVLTVLEVQLKWKKTTHSPTASQF